MIPKNSSKILSVVVSVWLISACTDGGAPLLPDEEMANDESFRPAIYDEFGFSVALETDADRPFQSAALPTTPAIVSPSEPDTAAQPAPVPPQAKPPASVAPVSTPSTTPLQPTVMPTIEQPEATPVPAAQPVAKPPLADLPSSPELPDTPPAAPTDVELPDTKPPAPELPVSKPPTPESSEDESLEDESLEDESLEDESSEDESSEDESSEDESSEDESSEGESSEDESSEDESSEDESSEGESSEGESSEGESSEGESSEDESSEDESSEDESSEDESSEDESSEDESSEDESSEGESSEGESSEGESSESEMPVREQPSEVGDSSEDDAPGPPPLVLGDYYQPQVLVKWQMQLKENLNASYDAEVFIVDLFSVSAANVAELQSSGKKVVCHFSAGTYQVWRPDRDSFKRSDLGENYKNWNGERWLDINSSNVRAIMTGRINMAEIKGCDGVVPDHVDGYNNETGFELTSADQLIYSRVLAGKAHGKDMSIGLKNSAELAKKLVPFYDFAVAESCAGDDRCDELDVFVADGKPVLHVEYNRKLRRNSAFNDFCQTFLDRQFSSLVLSAELDDSYRRSCQD